MRVQGTHSTAPLEPRSLPHRQICQRKGIVECLKKLPLLSSAEHGFKSLLFLLDFFSVVIKSCPWISNLKRKIVLSNPSIIKKKISPRYSPVHDNTKQDKHI